MRKIPANRPVYIPSIPFVTRHNILPDYGTGVLRGSYAHSVPSNRAQTSLFIFPSRRIGPLRYPAWNAASPSSGDCIKRPVRISQAAAASHTSSR